MSRKKIYTIIIIVVISILAVIIDYFESQNVSDVERFSRFQDSYLDSCWVAYSDGLDSTCQPQVCKGEMVVLIGSQGESPKSDVNVGKANGYRYFNGTRHFLQAGLKHAYLYKKLNPSSGVTIMVYDGIYSEKELGLYEKYANSLSIKFLKNLKKREIVEYVNSHKAIKLADFTYIGHSNPDKLLLLDSYVVGEFLDGSEFSKEVFDEQATVNLISCRSAEGRVYQNFKYLTKGLVRGYCVRVHWGEVKNDDDVSSYGLGYYCAWNKHPDYKDSIVEPQNRVKVERGERR